ncbi:hypothetical protein [Phytopseudomonas dryadis]|uniref:Uncharacterized protein n=1 Tax=Phytopseudomonas dryadis TaxID=2487520 RepID=A0A4Q9QWI2_9GAMM|nr:MULTISPECIES: hypothetical protein [Pseudomonas]TBU87652.1 hypothetical protein DNK44_19900 [Pseudomonas dryadis]TBV01916.1 hypothetical protein DNK34_20075 [Pseudomonas dryadis]TBV13865.1 hypothetical protein DNK41_21390 [Pseudomonas sp. FRB 230]
MSHNALPWRPFCTAVLVATLLGSIVQTQFNLAAIQQIGAPIPLDVRLHTTLQDLFGFTPTLAALVIAAFIVALPLAAWLDRLWGAARWLLFAVAGGLAIWAALSVANAVAPMPTLIGANRSLAGTLALMASGSAGALLFARLSAPARS